MTEGMLRNNGALKMICLPTIACLLTVPLPGRAQSLPTPAMTGPLQTASPHSFDAGPFGKLDITGIVSGMGLWQGNHTQGGALLLNYKFKHGLSLAGRGEYIKSTGNAAEQSVNLIFGPGSGGWSFALTPAYQNHGFFVRGDFSVVQATNLTPGSGFGPLGLNHTQPRGGIEAGFIF